MRSFFIDLENVRSYGLEGILLLKPEDKVYVFYSDNANTLTIPTIESLNESSAQVKYIKTNYIGANAMDFQIVTLLGASIEKEQTGRFYIISHDNGFKSAVKFCEGYFTGYDIVTGVFANILLAINSEKNTGLSAKKENRNNKQNSSAITNGTESGSNADEESQKETQSKRRSRNRRRKSGASNTASADNTILTESRDDKNIDQASTAEDSKNVTAQSVDTSDNETEKSNSRSRSKNRRRHGRNNNANTGDNDSLNNVSSGTDLPDNDADTTEAEDGFMIIQASETQKDSHQNSRRSRNRNNRKNGSSKDNKSDVDSMNDQDKKTVGNSKNSQSDIQKSSNYKYVYNALSEFLSKSTIDMYAAKIDEGIRHSANKNELHQFFKKNYGTDEAEALYKIIYSDFDKMKKEAGN